MAVIEVKNTRTGATVSDANNENSPLHVDLESQARLAEILADTPRLVKLAGTEWEVYALRAGTQWRIAKIVSDFNLKEGATMGDILKKFAESIPAVIDVLTLALLNDREKLFIDGNPRKGYSELYYATRDTIEWEGNKAEYSVLLLEIFQLLDVSFFTDDVLGTLQIFRTSITEKKRLRKQEEMSEQK